MICVYCDVLTFGDREFYTVIPHDFGFKKMREYQLYRLTELTVTISQFSYDLYLLGVNLTF
jgi:hypothetical protein